MPATNLKDIIAGVLKPRRVEVKMLLKPVLVEVQDSRSDSEMFNKLAEYIQVLLDIQQSLGEKMQPGGTVILDPRKAK